jgi:hypothetical protein
MARIVFNPISFGPSGLAQIVPIKLGGTGANNVAGAVSNLQLVSKSELNNGATGVAGLDANAKVRVSQLPTGAGGVVLLDANGSIPASYVPSGLVSKIVTLNGPTTVAVGQTATYTITNYDQFTTYNVSVSGGSASVNAGTVTLIAPSTTGQITLTINSVSFTINVVASVVNTPTITAPGNNVQGVSLKPTFTKSTFSVTGQAQTQTSVRWELSTTPTFTTLVDYYEGTSNYTSWMPSVMLSSLTTYYVRVKDQGSVSGYSNWSPVISFTTVQQVNFVTNLPGNGTNVLTLRDVVKLGAYLYAVGWQNQQGQGNFDGVIVKYDTLGNVIWQRGLGDGNSNAFRSIVTDGTYLYAAGDSNGSGFIVKYDTNGNLIWQRGLSSGSLFTTITTDGTYFYTVGSNTTSPQGGTYYDAYIVKWDANGTLIWQRGLGAGSGDSFLTVTMCNGYIYAVGDQNSQGQGDYDTLIAKYDTNGNLIWQRCLGGTGYDSFNAATSDGTYIYATGLQSSQGQGGSDAIIVKYDQNGNVIWQRSIGGSAYERLNGVTTDGTYLYAVGIQASQGQGSYDGLIVKYDLNGNLIWQRGLGGSSGDGFYGVCTDSGYLYVVGASSFSGLIEVSGGVDFTTGGSLLLAALPTSGNITLGALVGNGLTGLSWTQPTLTAYTSTLTVYTPTLTAYTPSLSTTTTTLTAYTPTLPTLYSTF